MGEDKKPQGERDFSERTFQVYKITNQSRAPSDSLKTFLPDAKLSLILFYT